MANIPVLEEPQFNTEVRKFETEDYGHADLFNAVVEVLVNNDAFLQITAAHLAETILTHVQDTDNPHDLQNKLDVFYQQLTAYTDKAISDLVGGAPETLDTIKEVADAIAEHKDVTDALDAAIGTKANKNELHAVATSGSYNDLNDKPTSLFDGGTITNDVLIQGDGDKAFMVKSTSQAARKIGMASDASGKCGIYDFTNGKWLLLEDIDGGLKIPGFTVTGSLTFANGVWNLVGDDVYIGDHNVAGGLGIKGANGPTRLDFIKQESVDNSDFKSIIYDDNGFRINGNADTATRALEDYNGNDIRTTYAQKNEVVPYTVVTDGNFNNMITPGIYTMRGNGTTHQPESGNDYWGLIVLRSDNGQYVQQIATKEGTTEVYVRFGDNYSWGDWDRLITDGELNSYQRKSYTVYTINQINGNTTYYLPTALQNANEWIIFLGTPTTGYNNTFSNYNWHVPVAAFAGMPTIGLLSGYSTSEYTGVADLLVTKTTLKVNGLKIGNTDFLTDGSAFVRIYYR